MKSALRTTTRSSSLCTWQQHSRRKSSSRQFTYNFAYEIEVRENRKGVFLSMLVREDFKENAEGFTELGYKFSISEETAGIVNDYDLPDEVECLFVE